MPLTNKRGCNLIKYLEIGFSSIYAFPGFNQNGAVIPVNPVAVDLLAGSTFGRAKVGGRTHLFEGAGLLINTSIGRSLYCKIIMGMESTMFLHLVGNGGRILAQGLSYILHSHVLIKAFLDKYSVIEG